MVPLTSAQDSGQSKRPRDARLIHMLFASLGVTAYQERVPLQLLDFAYRHTSSVLTDALHLSSDASLAQQSKARENAAAGGLRDAEGQVSANAVQLAISSRLQYQFTAGRDSGLSKEFLVETAQSRNKVALPRVLQNEWGVRLPNERFVLTGVPWALKEDWYEQEEEDADMGTMEGVEGEEPETGGDPAEGGDMEDIFGPTGGDEEMGMEE